MEPLRHQEHQEYYSPQRRGERRDDIKERLRITHYALLSGAGLLGAVGVIGYVLWAVNGGLVREGNWVGVDFHVYYMAAKALGQGQNIYDVGISPPYVYPPLLAVL